MSAALGGFLGGFNSGIQLREAADERKRDREARKAAREARPGAAAEAGMTPAPDFSLDADGDAASLIRQFEGYRDTPYWDVNAFRVGYGSDTTTGADGKVRRVEKGMKISREDADRDLARRTQEFARRARSQAGDAWGGLTPQAAAALTSIAYNYGSLPDRILPAVRSGDHDAIASAVEGLGGDNEGINAKRRAREAAIIRSGSDPRAVSLAASRYGAVTGRDLGSDIASAARQGITGVV